MALLLNTNTLLHSSSSQTKAAAFSKLSSSHSPAIFYCVKLQQQTPRPSVIRAASSVKEQSGSATQQTPVSTGTTLQFTGVHHVGLLCENLERSLDFYQGVLGLELNPDRPADKLPYRGAWFWVGAEMIHLMELPNPDPVTGRPDHGGRDRHACVAIQNLDPLKTKFDKAGVYYTQSKSGRPAIFARDPDGNALEFTQA